MMPTSLSDWAAWIGVGNSETRPSKPVEIRRKLRAHDRPSLCFVWQRSSLNYAPIHVLYIPTYSATTRKQQTPTAASSRPCLELSRNAITHTTSNSN